MALIHEVIDALRHEEATLNPKRWQAAVDRLEAWMREVEARIDGHPPDDSPHGIVVTHSPDVEKEASDAHETPATE